MLRAFPAAKPRIYPASCGSAIALAIFYSDVESLGSGIITDFASSPSFPLLNLRISSTRSDCGRAAKGPESTICDSH